MHNTDADTDDLWPTWQRKWRKTHPRVHPTTGATGILTPFVTVRVCTSALSALTALRVKKKWNRSHVTDDRVGFTGLPSQSIQTKGPSGGNLLFGRMNVYFLLALWNLYLFPFEGGRVAVHFCLEKKRDWKIKLYEDRFDWWLFQRGVFPVQ